MLNDTVALIKPLVEKKHIGLTTEIAPDLPHFVICDANRLRQVLLNLLVNGVKFTNTGFVALRVDVHRKYAPCHRAARLAASIRELDWTQKTKNPSFNLFNKAIRRPREICRHRSGLAISRQIVNLMGGELNVESEANFWSQIFLCNPHGSGGRKTGRGDNYP